MYLMVCIICKEGGGEKEGVFGVAVLVFLVHPLLYMKATSCTNEIGKTT